jgi:hypothetical protein
VSTLPWPRSCRRCQWNLLGQASLTSSGLQDANAHPSDRILAIPPAQVNISGVFESYEMAQISPSYAPIVHPLHSPIQQACHARSADVLGAHEGFSSIPRSGWARQSIRTSSYAPGGGASSSARYLDQCGQCGRLSDTAEDPSQTSRHLSRSKRLCYTLPVPTYMLILVQAPHRPVLGHNRKLSIRHKIHLKPHPLGARIGWCPRDRRRITA